MTSAKPNSAQDKARQRLQALSANLRVAAKHPGKEKSIHDLRVAIRRFTQVLRVFGSGFEHTRRMRRRLRGLMDLCGAVRNCDIAFEVLEAAGAPAQPALRSRLKRRRVRASRQLAKLLKDGDLRAHMRRWRGWLTISSGEQAKVPPMPSLDSREFLRSGSAAARADADYPQMHEFRLVVKKLRYTLEILGSGGAQLAALRALQERLGSINDCVTTADLISEMKLDAPEQRRIKAALNRLLARRAAEFRIYWRANFGRKRVGRKRSSG
jgi:CHAD domain-containing protein